MGEAQIATRAELAIRAALAGRGGLGELADQLRLDDDLYGSGLTSLGSVRVMLAIEGSLSIEFPDELLTRDLFATIGNLTAACTRLISRADVTGGAGPSA
jgi:acyl carrier protein